MEKVVFTNGCFDLIHPGHVDLLTRARALGTKLIVGINSDASVRAIKGRNRPLMSENDRAAVLVGLKAVDEVRVFDEATPERLIRELCPDVLVKGGDWPVGEIVGADFVRSRGGEVHSLALLGDHSTSRIVESLQSAPPEVKVTDDVGPITRSISEHLQVLDELRAINVQAITVTAQTMIDAFRRGGKVLICGNGGSAADAQHLAAELVGRFETERASLPAIALTTDTSALTAIANDYDFERIYARQIEGLGRAGDVLVAISTSGNSANIIAAVMKARQMGLKTIGLTGSGGKKLASLCDQAILVPSPRTARIQEAHITIAHLWCEFIDKELTDIEL
ncbi:MAG: SIS domain-containing protein [Acidobacteria bacterium]|nr:SIS domain-containing protein [Acidobacteriota bacterium]MBK8811511.1 SIS domain-containing protein [Acidobacteriota bacterium]